MEDELETNFIAQRTAERRIPAADAENITHVFRSAPLLKRFFIMILIWFVIVSLNFFRNKSLQYQILGSRQLWATTVSPSLPPTWPVTFSSTTNSPCKSQLGKNEYIEKFAVNLGHMLVPGSRIVEIPAYIAGMYAMDRIGRRPTLSSGLLVSGLACLVTGLAPSGIRP